MKYSKACRLLASSVAIALLLTVVAVSPVAAATIDLDPKEGEIDSWVYVDISGISVSVRLYFSNDKAGIGEKIGDQVRAYYEISNTTGFRVPDRLEDGSRQEDVHAGEYYVYVASLADREIQGFTTFTVIKGGIWLTPEEGSVGDEIIINGTDFRPEQAIAVEYEDDDVAITGGDTMTDSEGKFTSTVVVPESVMGEHVFVVTDESEDELEAVFTVVPKITLVPPEQESGKEVEVIGTGFRDEYAITLALDGKKVSTTPSYIETDLQGSFSCVFLTPLYDSPAIAKVKASDRHFSKAEADLAVLGGIRLSPLTNPASPGYVGMELTIYGTGFIENAAVTITYHEDDEVIATETTTADPNGSFMLVFNVPPSAAGSHVIKATDGATTGAAIFIMESEAPLVPVPLLPEAAGTAEEQVRFDWGDVNDPSGISYTLQVSSDIDFNTLAVDREGILLSEYTLTGEEKLTSAGQKAYYWRVKAVDGAYNESKWSSVGLFYVGFSHTAMSGGVWYIFYGLIALVLAGLVFWFYRRRSR